MYSVSQAEEVRIAVLLSHDAAPYESALAGFRETLLSGKAAVQYDLYPLYGDSAKALLAIEDIKKKKVSVIYSLGMLATETALEKITDIPVITGLTISSDRLAKAKNATGVMLDFPLKTQFENINRFLPEAGTVGIIYNSRQFQQMLHSAKKTAGEMDLKLEVQRINSPRELPEALNAIANKADVFLGINDNVVFTQETAKHILLFSYRNHIPFIGLSSEWVKAGALYSLDRDYKSIGVQCGEMALKVLNGTAITSISLDAPRIVTYSINMKTAEQMKIRFPEAVVKNANKVY